MSPRTTGYVAGQMVQGSNVHQSWEQEVHQSWEQEVQARLDMQRLLHNHGLTPHGLLQSQVCSLMAFDKASSNSSPSALHAAPSAGLQTGLRLPAHRSPLRLDQGQQTLWAAGHQTCAQHAPLKAWQPGVTDL